MGTAVVKVTAVWLTLRVQRGRGVRGRAHAPAVTRRREAGEELMLDTLVTSRAGGGAGVRRGQGLREDAGPTATPHLGAADVSVSAVAGVTLLLPTAAVRKL